jgi:hypothetical protein
MKGSVKVQSIVVILGSHTCMFNMPFVQNEAQSAFKSDLQRRVDLHM